MNYDIAIIGGGPAGYTTAINAARKGLTVILFEKEALGGVCLNEGCIPTKALLHSAHLYQDILSASKFGIESSETPTVNYKKILSRKTKIIRKLTAGIKAELQSLGVTIHNSAAQLNGERNNLISIQSNGNEFLAKNVLLCPGGYAFVPELPGLSNISYLTSREALNLSELPDSITIIGGGVIGIEFADLYNSLGVSVTVIEVLPKILGGTDREISALLQERLTKKGVSFYLGAKVSAVSPNAVSILTAEGEELNIPTQNLLISTGRRPNLENLGLETLQISHTAKGITVNKHMQTSHPKIFAAGDITGFSQLAHTAIKEGEVALNNILNLNTEMNYNSIPGIVYTHPEVASVGLSEEELIKQGITFKAYKLPLTHSGRFVVENEMETGLLKLLISEDQYILGAHMIGNPASEIILTLGIAIQEKLSITQLSNQIYPHPTVGEILHEAFSRIQ